MNANVRTDLPTSQDAGSKHHALILNLSRSTGGPIFAIICFINPIVKVMFTCDLRDKVCFGYIDNEDRNRMNALRALVGDKYRRDIISNNIGEWNIDEYIRTPRGGA